MSKRTVKRSNPPSQASDGFQNFLLKLGDVSVTQQGASYNATQLSRNYQMLTAMYRSSWIVGQAVDAIAEDMTRCGIDIINIEPEEEKELQQALTRNGIWQGITTNLKWGRLFGGAAALILITGQAPESPLLLDRIGQDQFEGLMVFDRQELMPDPSRRITTGVNMGLPEFYTVPKLGLTIHHSRLVRSIGKELPRQQSEQNSWWGMSIVEPLYDRLVAFDTATHGTAQLISKAYLRTVQVEQLREILSKGGVAEDNMVKMFSLMRQLQSNEGITLLDAKDKFEAHSYTFAGLEALITQFAQQCSGATGIPLIRLGIPQAGLGDTGESQMRQYHENVSQQQEARLRLGLHRVVEIQYRSLFGKPPPKGFDFTFNPLKQLDSKEKADAAAAMVKTIVEAYDAGLIDRAVAMRELQYIATICGQFNSVTVELVDKAQAEIDDAAAAPPGEGGTLDPLTGLPLPPPPVVAAQPSGGPDGKPKAQ